MQVRACLRLEKTIAEDPSGAGSRTRSQPTAFPQVRSPEIREPSSRRQPPGSIAAPAGRSRRTAGNSRHPGVNRRAPLRLARPDRLRPAGQGARHPGDNRPEVIWTRRWSAGPCRAAAAIAFRDAAPAGPRGPRSQRGVSRRPKPGAVLIRAVLQFGHGKVMGHDQQAADRRVPGAVSAGELDRDVLQHPAKVPRGAVPERLAQLRAQVRCHLGGPFRISARSSVSASIPASSSRSSPARGLPAARTLSSASTSSRRPVSSPSVS